MLPSSALLLIAMAAQATQTPAPAEAQPPAAEAKPTPDGAVIAIETTMGPIQIALYATKSPRSSRNVLNYVKAGHYNGTIFHRVMAGFMIQGGGLDPKMVEKPTVEPVRNEARNGLSNTRGSVALARTNEPHSATSQFFINLKDNAALDFGIARDGWGYTVVGEVLSGMEVVDAIAQVPTTRTGVHEHAPVRPVVITRARVVSEPPPPPPVVKTGAPASAPASGKKPKATPTPR